jgi:predicted dehydrogenase
MAEHIPSRRTFIQSAAALSASATLVGGALGAAPAIKSGAWGSSGRGMARLKVGVIGCGGRGTGAAVNSLEGSEDTEIWALGDVMKDRLEGAYGQLKNSIDPKLAARVTVTPERCFSGFDAYKQVIASGVDLVILATAPGFRPMHFAAAVEAGKHVFFEKPVAVDPAGVRLVMKAGELAKQKNLAVVTGTQRRHENCYLEAMKRLESGAIGKVLAANCWWNQGPLWVNKKDPKWSDMEWQIRNWLYFTWLSGDHIVEQHVHNIDVCNWAMGGPPVKCMAMGGREVRRQPEYGHIFDHFAVQYTYTDGRVMNSQCRQIEGCASKVAEQIIGSEGELNSTSGSAEISGKNPWKHPRSKNNDPYVTEHTDLVASIIAGKPLNEAQRIAESTLTAIMGRMSAYTGQEVTFDQALKSKLDLTPPSYAFDQPMPVPEVAVPGKTALI